MIYMAGILDRLAQKITDDCDCRYGCKAKKLHILSPFMPEGFFC